jgi:hypothetical protein
MGVAAGTSPRGGPELYTRRRAVSSSDGECKQESAAEPRAGSLKRDIFLGFLAVDVNNYPPRRGVRVRVLKKKAARFRFGHCLSVRERSKL